MFCKEAAVVYCILQVINMVVIAGLIIYNRHLERQFEDAAYTLSLIPDPRDTTCWNCDDMRTCSVAFDAYNTDGDCLNK